MIAQDEYENEQNNNNKMGRNSECRKCVWLLLLFGLVLAIDRLDAVEFFASVKQKEYMMMMFNAIPSDDYIWVSLYMEMTWAFFSPRSLPLPCFLYSSSLLPLSLRPCLYQQLVAIFLESFSQLLYCRHIAKITNKKLHISFRLKKTTKEAKKTQRKGSRRMKKTTFIRQYSIVVEVQCTWWFVSFLFLFFLFAVQTIQNDFDGNDYRTVQCFYFTSFFWFAAPYIAAWIGSSSPALHNRKNLRNALYCI